LYKRESSQGLWIVQLAQANKVFEESFMKVWTGLRKAGRDGEVLEG
jgi:hypothetical protein